MFDSTVLAFVLVLLFALNVFLYYRWKGLKEELEETQKSKRIQHGKDYVSHFSWDSSGMRKETDSQGFVEEARKMREELRGVLESDLVQLQQKIIGVNEKLA